VRLRDATVAADAGRARVDTEVGRLRSVLLHRPGDELRAIDDANARRLLFAKPVDLAQAQDEHDGLANALRDRGVEVVYLSALLEHVASRSRDALLAMALPDVHISMRRRFALRTARQIARALTRPLPNLLFTRDPSVWIAGGPMVGAMATGVRRREAALLRAIYELHPRFEGALLRPHGVEGGDVLVAGPGRVIVGISPRTTTANAHRLASALLLGGAATEVITIRMPRGAGFHLDLVLTMVDRQTFAVWAPVRHDLRAHRWRATTGGVAVSAVTDPLSHSRVIEVGATRSGPHGREWDHGVNVLAVAPGVVVSYADNDRANAQLAAAGIEVIAVPGAALANGRGGPRCLSCPLDRDAC
jgi:arginine deiminase